MPTTVTLAGVEMEHPLMNAGGTCKTLEEVQRFARSAVSAVMVNLLVPERPGNSGNTYWSNGHYSLNSKGLPSRGKQYYVEVLPEMVRIVHQAGKKIFVNISGFTPEEYADLAHMAAKAGVDAIEFNFGCPNIWKDGMQKKILSFDLAGIAYTLRLVGAFGLTIPVGTKLSPYSDPGMINSVSMLLGELDSSPGYVRVSFLTLCNTFPNAYIPRPDGKSVISVGLAGLAGKAMKPIALGQILQFKTLQDEEVLPDHIQFVGAGGVGSNQDVQDFLAVGATAVQAATAYFDHDENPSAYSDILLD
jgi:dihydroorotate dehydrogenase (fumarate)